LCGCLKCLSIIVGLGKLTWQYGVNMRFYLYHTNHEIFTNILLSTMEVWHTIHWFLKHLMPYSLPQDRAFNKGICYKLVTKIMCQLRIHLMCQVRVWQLCSIYMHLYNTSQRGGRKYKHMHLYNTSQRGGKYKQVSIKHVPKRREVRSSKYTNIITNQLLY